MEVITTQRKNGRSRIQFKSNQPSKVEKSHKKAVDINTIVAKYRKTGLMPYTVMNPTYGDFTKIGDFHDAKNRIIKAESDFLALPSDIRKMFDNDVGKFVEFVNNPDNLEEAAELGLVDNLGNYEPQASKDEIVDSTDSQTPSRANEEVVTTPKNASESG